ncbi:MAG: MFS transporter [Rhodospirillaceae bacterium]|nr:MFS transporter [Rhodospirillaceae bacterium]
MSAETTSDREDRAGASGKGAAIGLLFRDPNYLSIWLLGSLTGFIRWFQLLALGVYTFEITGSPLLVAIVPILWGLPLAICGPVIGGVADRVNRKLMLGASIAMILVVAVTMATLAYTGGLAVTHIFIASLMSGLFWATDMPVRRRLLGDVAGAALATAMSFDAATNSATRMMGPLLGGVMLQLVGITGVFVLSSSVYAIGLVLILSTKLPAPSMRVGQSALIQDLIAGIRFVLGNWELRRVLAVTVVFNVWGFPFTAMIPILGKERLGLDPFQVGLLSSLEGFGAFLGAMVVALYATPVQFGRIFLWGASLYLVMIFYLGILSFVAGGPNHSFIAAALSLTVMGLAGACFATMQSTLTYLGAQPEYRSRVFGVLALCIGTGPIGFLNVGWMAESFGVPTALLVISVEGLFAFLLLWIYGVLSR